MNLFEVIQPLKIIHPFGGERIIAALFPAPNGLYFFDIGWDDPLNSTHPIHFVEGKVEGDGPWTIGNSKIEVIQDNDALIPSLIEWQKHTHPDNDFAFQILLEEFPADAEKNLKWEQNK